MRRLPDARIPTPRMLANETAEWDARRPLLDGGLITLLVPTTGRSTLDRTLLSLQQQQDPEWRALVLADGAHVHLQTVAAEIARRDKRIRVWRLGARHGANWRSGHGMAGNVRNYAFPHVKTPWVGFVDDDDTLGPDYVSLVAAEEKGYQCIMFRVRWSPWARGERPFCFGYGCTRSANNSLSEVLPEWNASFIGKGHGGISFAMRTNLTARIRFGNNMFEDYYMRQAMAKAHLPILQSPHVTYYVKGVPRPEVRTGRRIENPAVCTFCVPPPEEALRIDCSYDYELARWLASGDGDYERHRQALLHGVCPKGNSTQSPGCRVVDQSACGSVAAAEG